MSFPPGFIRGFIANYGVPILVIVWSGVSYAPAGSVPEGIPRRLTSPNSWSPLATTHWDVIRVSTVNVELYYIKLCFYVTHRTYLSFSPSLTLLRKYVPMGA